MGSTPNGTSFTRRQFIGSSAYAVLATAIGYRWSTGQQQTPPPTAFTELRDGVGIFTGRGGTIGWMADGSGTLVIDTQMPGTAETCLEGMMKRSPTGIDLLVNSHHHFDHTGGNGIFRPKVKDILAHANVPGLQRAGAERMKRSAADEVVANLTYTDTWSGSIGKESLRLRYWGPAHTGGDSVIHFEKANIVHTGDLVFNRVAPVIDTPGGSIVANWITVLEKIDTTFNKETLFIFGHGSEGRGVTGKKEDVLAMRDYLVALLDYVSKGVKSGKSEDEVAGIDALPGFEEYSKDRLKERFQGGIRQTYAQLIPKKQ